MLPKQLKTLNIHNSKIVPRIYSTEWANMKFWYEDTLKVTRARGMAVMLKFLRLPLLGRHHCGIDDCKNIWQVVQRLIEKGFDLQHAVKYKFQHEAWPKELEA
eukprot:Phypoly_transcript_17526.p1 GENE.Phypoly_transcript_17526~~Phypoly_transcript_17526.p1  ORF type:complete len:103 (+),score=1.74 Phypoly_transcript_17526:449-757(+)